MPPVPGYLQAVRGVCDKYNVPLVFDEIMCGWGRCGTLHAWQTYGVVPDIQLLGKGLVGGFEMLSAMLVGKKLGFMDAIREGSGYFNHGHTFQGMPKTCAGALETMKMVTEQLPNVKAMGERLMKGLRARLEVHPYVGDVRGVGLFIGVSIHPPAGGSRINFVRLNSSKTSSPRLLSIQTTDCLSGFRNWVRCSSTTYASTSC
jgi:adenosylmethionine-8-amino-7-oxononanoate aminotransferase